MSVECLVPRTELRTCCLPNSRPSSVLNLKPLSSIARTPSPTTESFNSKKPRPSSERDAFASSSENAVDAIYGCGMSLDQNLAVVEKDEIRLYSSGGSSFIHVMQITRDDAGSPEAVSPIEAYGGGEGRHRTSNERTGA